MAPERPPSLMARGRGRKLGIYHDPATGTETIPLPAYPANIQYYEGKGFKFLRYYDETPMSSLEAEIVRMRADMQQLMEQNLELARMVKGDDTSVATGESAEDSGAPLAEERPRRPYRRNS